MSKGGFTVTLVAPPAARGKAASQKELIEMLTASKPHQQAIRAILRTAKG
jgi:hypothetical protein